ncbi:MAG: radical SAM protein [Clostridiales bacterium]|jgi:organic radical activating enzyme|nr:radical SAM protein [Clostridiales bacterium]
MIKRFIECKLPYYHCNLKCDYCYVIQENNRNREESGFIYSVSDIKAATAKERFEGMCFFSICAAGETLAPPETIPIAKALLENGHFVNITNNGTMIDRIKELCELPKELRRRLLLSFSFHYLELEKFSLTNTFFENVDAVKSAAISFFIQMNLYDGYIPYIENIKRICKERAGAYPQCLVTRRRTREGYAFHSNLPADEYMEFGRQFCSPLFTFTADNFMKRQKGFCYAGDWSFSLDLGSGVMKRCYLFDKGQDVFRNPYESIRLHAVGSHCPSAYCMNASHFISQGVIPDAGVPSYARCRDRPEAGWFNDTARELLNGKLYKSNHMYSQSKKFFINAMGYLDIKNEIKRAAILLPRV